MPLCDKQSIYLNNRELMTVFKHSSHLFVSLSFKREVTIFYLAFWQDPILSAHFDGAFDVSHSGKQFPLPLTR